MTEEEIKEARLSEYNSDRCIGLPFVRLRRSKEGRVEKCRSAGACIYGLPNLVKHTANIFPKSWYIECYQNIFALLPPIMMPVSFPVILPFFGDLESDTPKRPPIPAIIYNTPIEYIWYIGDVTETPDLESNIYHPRWCYEPMCGGYASTASAFTLLNNRIVVIGFCDRHRNEFVSTCMQYTNNGEHF